MQAANECCPQGVTCRQHVCPGNSSACIPAPGAVHVRVVKVRVPSKHLNKYQSQDARIFLEFSSRKSDFGDLVRIFLIPNSCIVFSGTHQMYVSCFDVQGMGLCHFLALH